MTASEYQLKIDGVDNTIASLTRDIAALKTRAAASDLEAATYSAQAAASNCNAFGMTQKNKARCAEDVNFKRDRAKYHSQAAKSDRETAAAKAIELAAQDALRTEYVNAQKTAQTTQKEVELTLANQGKTYESVGKTADAEAERLRLLAQIEGDNLKNAGEVRNEALKGDLDNKKKITTVIIVVAAVVVITIGVILYKKYKSKKSKP